MKEGHSENLPEQDREGGRPREDGGALPFNGGSRPSETRSKDHQNNLVPTLEASFAVGLIQCNGYSRCGGVSIFVQIGEDAIFGHRESVGDGIDDAEVGLMWHH